MVMALVWNDAKSFKQHLEDMRIFRQTHRTDLEGNLALLKDMPTPSNIHTPSETGGGRGFTGARGKPLLVPVWDIVLPRGSQN